MEAKKIVGGLIKAGRREWLSLGAAFLGPCGGQREMPPVGGLRGPEIDLEVIRENGSGQAQQPVARPRRETFSGL